MAITHSHHHDPSIIPVGSHVADDGTEFGADVHGELLKAAEHTHEGVWMVPDWNKEPRIVTHDPSIPYDAEMAAVDAEIPFEEDEPKVNEAEVQRDGMARQGTDANREARVDADTKKAAAESK